MRYRVWIGFGAGEADTGELELEDGRRFALGADDIARLNGEEGRADPDAVLEAIVAEREAPAVRHG